MAMKVRPGLSVETQQLRAALKSATQSIYPGTERAIGSFTCGVYAFFDYDGEPIYVGQTVESLSGRVGRHLTNQRTDSVAMAVLDPYEVCWIEFYPLIDFDGKKGRDAKNAVSRLELAVYTKLIDESSFSAILNEKSPAAIEGAIDVPQPLRCKIVSEHVEIMRGHPDVRLARRAQTISRLAQIISERQVNVGLRKTLLVQAKRLAYLADVQFSAWGGESATPTKRVGEEDDGER